MLEKFLSPIVSLIIAEIFILAVPYKGRWIASMKKQSGTGKFALTALCFTIGAGLMSLPGYYELTKPDERMNFLIATLLAALGGALFLFPINYLISWRK